MKDENDRLQIKYIQLSLHNLKALKDCPAVTAHEALRLTSEYVDGLNAGIIIRPTSEDPVAQSIFEYFLKSDVEDSLRRLEKNSLGGKKSAAARRANKD